MINCRCTKCGSVVPKVEKRPAKVGDLVYQDKSYVQYGHPHHVVIFIAPEADGDCYAKTRILAKDVQRNTYGLLTLENVVLADEINLKTLPINLRFKWPKGIPTPFRDGSPFTCEFCGGLDDHSKGCSVLDNEG